MDNLSALLAGIVAFSKLDLRKGYTTRYQWHSHVCQFFDAASLYSTVQYTNIPSVDILKKKGVLSIGIPLARSVEIFPPPAIQHR